ncbi:MAG: helix-turn-helix domain-containing protein [Candidatus Caldarchaeum sp.]|nr:helix-turn-helix domain-containing protein [Candidatus Caldarchaeum sp.]
MNKYFSGLRLDEVFASKAHATVLQFLIENPGKGFSLRYIARATGVAPSTVGIVVNNLERVGLVLQRRLYAVKLIALNHENPIAQELAKLVEKIREV